MLNLVGKTFGQLTVIKFTGINKHRKSTWLCQCDCKENNIIIVTGSDLKSGHTQSCGCLQKEKVFKVGKNNKKYNTYDLSGEYGIGYTTKGEEFYFDLEDYDKIKNYCWSVDDNGYLIAKNSTNQMVKQHRIILNYCGDKDIDHINGNLTRNDNRKYNLRICTRSQNCMNQDSLGIYKEGDKWKASICVNYEHIYLGLYDTHEKALEIRRNAEEKYFGEYKYKRKADEI